MQVVSSAYNTALNAGTLEMVALVTIVRQDGVIERLCNQHIAVSDGTYSYDRGLGPDGVGDIQYDANGNVSYVNILLTLASNGLDAHEIIRRIYDLAKVTISWAHWSDTTDIVSQFIGTVADVDMETERTVILEVRSLLAKAKKTVPVQVVKECPAILGDSEGFYKCNVDMSLFTDTFTITSVDISTEGVTSPIQWDATFSTARDDDFYRYGVATFLTGSIAGNQLEVRSHKGSHIITWGVVPGFTPEIGDTGTITAGCDHRMPTCKDKFDNVLNFQGYWWIVPRDVVAQQSEDPKTEPNVTDGRGTTYTGVRGVVL